MKAIVAIKCSPAKTTAVGEFFRSLCANGTEAGGGVCPHHREVEGGTAPPCASVTVVDLIATFGSFDYFLIAEARDVNTLVEFNLICMRQSDTLKDVIFDTQTVVGVSVLEKGD